MSLDGRLQELIGVAWKVIERDFDQVAFARWREEAASCLCEMFGPDHPYCRQFENSVEKRDKLNILVAGGVLEAARTQTSCCTISDAYTGATSKPSGNFGISG